MLTVNQLRELIKDAPDDAKIFIKEIDSPWSMRSKLTGVWIDSYEIRPGKRHVEITIGYK